MTTKNNKISSCLLIFILMIQMIGASAFIKTPIIEAVDIPDSLESEQPAYVEGEVIVKYKQTSSSTSTSSLETNLELTPVEEVSLIGAEVMEITSGESVEEIVASLEASGLVEYAQPNYIYYANTVTPLDSNWNNLWGLHNTGQTINNISGGTIDIDIDALEAWEYTNGLDEIIVAVIDTGVQISHPDLAGKIWTNPGEIPNDLIDNDGNGYVNDINGWDFYNHDNSVFDLGINNITYDNHGTHVAGTIAAVADSSGVRGVAPNVKIMPVKFLDGPNGSGSTSDAINAIEYAASKGAKIANASWGSHSPIVDILLKVAIDTSGMLFVAAAGNGYSVNQFSPNIGINLDDNNDLHDPFYPANFLSENIISVAAVDNKGALAVFSNYGGSSVDVGAPGVNIFSTYPFNGYAHLSGTSMAVPHVAGIAAVIMGQKNVGINETIELLKNSGVNLNSLLNKTASGKMVNLNNAVATQVSQPTVVHGTASLLNASSYAITFNTGTYGKLIPTDTITIKFPVGTNVPPITADNIIVNGVAVGTNSLTLTPQSQDLTFPSPVTVAHGTAMNIVIAQEANIINPPDSSYTLTVKTSTDPVPVTSANYVVDSTAPLLSSAIVNGNSLILTYNEVLDPTSIPINTDFIVNTKPLSNLVAPQIISQTIVLSLQGSLTKNDVITVNYTAGANPIRDVKRNNAINLSNRIVTNITPPSEPVLISYNALTNDNTPLIVVQAETGTTIKVNNGTTTIGSGDGLGIGTSPANDVNIDISPLPLSPLIDGIYTLTMTATDNSSGLVSLTRAIPITIDTMVVAAPIIVSQPVRTNNFKPTMVVKAELNSLIKLYNGASEIGSATGNGNNNVNITPTLNLPSVGIYNLTVTATDLAGNVSELTIIPAIVIETTPPGAPSVINVNDNDLIVSGTAEPDSIVKVLGNNNSLLGSITANSISGLFSVPIPIQLAGSDLNVTATDQAGNTGVATVVDVINTSPSIPMGLQASAGNGLISLSWSPNPELDITNYNIYQNGVLLVRPITLQTNYTMSSLANGSSYSFTITAKDGIHESQQSSAVSATPETPPSAPPQAPNNGGGNSGGGGGGGGFFFLPPPPPPPAAGLIPSTGEQPKEKTTMDAPAFVADATGVKLDSSASTITSETSNDGKSVSKVTLDAEKLSQAFAALASNTTDQTLIFQVARGSESIIKVQLPAAALAAAILSTPNAIVSIQSAVGSYALPLQILDFKAIALKLGVNTADLKLIVNIETITGNQASQLSTNANAAGLTLLTAAVDFSITAEGNGAIQEVNDFGSTYVNRTLTVNQLINSNEATAVMYNPVTGAMTFVPATFITINGKTEVTIKRNGNSIYTVVEFNKKFIDLDGHWAKSDIEQMASKLIVKGYTEATFRPNDNITRAQFASILIQSLGLTANKGGAIFSDVNTQDWYSGFIGAASVAGLTSGFSDGSFKPNDFISREQMAVMISKAIKFSGKQTNLSGTQDELLMKFSDKHLISSWAKAAAAQCIDAGIISGLREQSFAPSAKATRAQAVVMVKHMLEHVGFIN